LLRYSPFTGAEAQILSTFMARLKSCPDTKQKAATLHGHELADPSGNLKKKANLDWSG